MNAAPIFHADCSRTSRYVPAREKFIPGSALLAVAAAPAVAAAEAATHQPALAEQPRALNQRSTTLRAYGEKGFPHLGANAPARLFTGFHPERRQRSNSGSSPHLA